jgi:hypothetical protein
MNVLKKYISVLMLSAMLTTRTSIAYADELLSDGDFLEVKKDDSVPFDGYLFTDSGLSKVIVNKELERKKIILDKDAEIERTKLQLNTELKKKQVEIDINKELSDKLLKLREEEVDRLNSELKYKNWIVAGSFMGGILIGSVAIISIVKLTVSVMN